MANTRYANRSGVLRGFIVPRLLAANLIDVTSEGSPGANADDTMALLGSPGLSVDWEVYAPGVPGTSTFTVTATGDTDTLGCDTPQTLTAVIPVAYAGDATGICVTSTGKLLIAVGGAYGTLDSTWAMDDTIAPPNYLLGGGDGALVALAEGAAMSASQRFDPDTLTWVDRLQSGVSNFPYLDATPATIPSRYTQVWANGVLCHIEVTDGYEDVHQFVSYDEGITWEELANTYGGADWGHSPNAAVFSDGSVLVGYVTTAASPSGELPLALVLGTPAQAIDDVGTGVAVDGTGAIEVQSPVVAIDSRDVAYYLARKKGTNNLVLWQSTDRGATWTQLSDPQYTNENSNSFTPVQAVCWRGSLLVLGTVTGSVTTSAILVLGGWSSAPQGFAYSSANSGNLFAPVFASTAGGVDWTQTGTAGVVTSSTDGEDYYVQISTVAAQGQYARNLADPGPIAFEVALVSGGSASTNDVAVKVQMDSGANTARHIIRFEAAQFTIVGLATTVVTWDCTLPTQFYLARVGSSLIVRYRRRGADVWQSAGTLPAEVIAAATAGVTWGHLDASTAVSRWYWITTASGTQSVSYPTLGGNGLMLPARFDGDDGVCYLAHVAGLTLPGEAATLAPRYTGASANALPDGDPSIAALWNSTDTTEQIFEFEFEADTSLGAAPALAAFGANFQTAYLEAYNLGTLSWDTVATLDLGIVGSVAWTRSGTLLTPALAAGTYLARDELKGAWLKSNSAGYYIGRNDGGNWDPATLPVAYTTLTDVPAATSGAGDTIVATHGAVVAHETSRRTASRWRVRIPAQVCPDDFFKGKIIAGYFQPLGKQWSAGYAVDVETAYSETVLPSGARIRRRTGTPPRRWTVNFADGFGNERRAGGPYDGFSDGMPLVSRGDVLDTYAAILDECEAGALPIVALKAVPAAGGTQTRKDLMLYGWLSDGFGSTNVSGDDGATNEYSRGSSLIVDEVL